MKILFTGPVKLVALAVELIFLFFYGVYAVLTGSVSGGQWVYRLIKRQKETPIHGDASFASDKQLKAGGYLTPGGFLMGTTLGTNLRIYSRPERSAIMMAQPGSGKSQHFIAYLRSLKDLKPEDRPHLVLGDPANELYTATAELLKELGYIVGRIDLIEPDKWAKYDILSYLNPNDRYGYDRDLKALCELMVPEEPGSKHPHFVEFSRIILKSVITVAVKHEGNTRCIADVVKEVVIDDKREALLKRIKAYDDDYVKTALALFERMQKNPEGTSMLSTSLRKLEIWSDNAIREVTTFRGGFQGASVRGWKWEEVFANPKPSAIFLRAGLGTGGGELSRIIYGNAINTVRRSWNKTGKPIPRNIRLIIDEAKTVGNCNAVMDGHNELRKAGVRVMLCFLSREAFQDTYPEWKTLWNGCDVAVYPGGKDMDLLNDVSALVGDMTIENLSESESDQGKSKGRSQQARRRIKADEIRRLPLDEALLLLDGLAVHSKRTWRRVTKGDKAWIEYP